MGKVIRFLTPKTFRRRRVLVRLDLNVAMAGGRLGDPHDLRLERALPTIRMLLAGSNALVLLSHHSDGRQTLRPLARYLSRRLRHPVTFLANPLGARALGAVRRAKPRTIFLVENLRFWPGERANSSVFARALARLGEAYVSDAFGELHRPYASVAGLPRLLPAFAGPLVRRELAVLGSLLRRPARPFVVIIGGAKAETKLPLIRHFLRRADRVLVGGVAATLLLAGEGRMSRAILRLPGAERKLVLPVDGRFRVGRRRKLVALDALKVSGEMGDVGPATIRRFAACIHSARTILWNGPLGRVEDPAFAAGTRALARLVARSHAARVVGGGDTVAFLRRAGFARGVGYLSTGGGAMLAYLAGERLPGLEALGKSKAT